ncbi:MAG: cytochrome b/b6 domain-containing protein [Pseudomonadota bacterium]
MARNTADDTGTNTLTRAKPRSAGRVYDQPDSFGWLSIALHWLSAVIIIAMWIIGQNISAQADGSPDGYRQLHITLGLSAWLLLAGRIVWRARVPHPRSAGVGDRTHRFARAFHYVMLALLTLLILSGPLVAWTVTPAPIGAAAYTVHRNAGNAMFVLVVLHILGALKHLMFHHDDSIVRMLWPKRPTDS